MPLGTLWITSQMLALNWSKRKFVMKFLNSEVQVIQCHGLKNTHRGTAAKIYMEQRNKCYDVGPYRQNLNDEQ